MTTVPLYSGLEGTFLLSGMLDPYCCIPLPSDAESILRMRRNHDDEGLIFDICGNVSLSDTKPLLLELRPFPFENIEIPEKCRKNASVVKKKTQKRNELWKLTSNFPDSRSNFLSSFRLAFILALLFFSIVSFENFK